MAPPAVGNNTVYNVNVKNVMFVVPGEAIEAYQSHPVWRMFLIEPVTRINVPQPSDAEDKDNCAWYDLCSHSNAEAQTHCGTMAFPK